MLAHENGDVCPLPRDAVQRSAENAPAFGVWSAFDAPACASSAKGDGGLPQQPQWLATSAELWGNGKVRPSRTRSETLHIDISEFDHDEEILDCVLDGYEMHALTMLDAPEENVSWGEEAKVRGIQMTTKAPPVEFSLGDVHRVVLDSGADLFWISGRLASKTNSTSQMFMHFCCLLESAYVGVWTWTTKMGILGLCHAVEVVMIHVTFKKNNFVVDAKFTMVQKEVPQVRPVKESRIVGRAGFDLHVSCWPFLELGSSGAPCVDVWPLSCYPTSFLGARLSC